MNNRLLAVAAIALAMTQAAFGQPSVPLPSTIGSETAADRLESQARKNGDALIPTCRFEGAKCGYTDRNGKTIIAPQYDWADLFVEGRGLVGSAGKFGAIDATGRFAIVPTYDSIGRFDRGLAAARVGDRLGVINRDGQWVVPAEHGLIVRIADDTFLVAEPPAVPSRELGSLGDRLVRMHPFAFGKRWGIVANSGTWVMQPKFAQVSALSDDLTGLFWAANTANASARWQLMGRDGNPVSNDLFDHVQQIPSGQDRAVVQRGGRWGAVNGKGEIVVEMKFDWLGYFRDGWAPYRLGGREGRIDQNGNTLTNTPAQPSIADPNAKLGAVVNGNTLYTDRAGTKLLGTDHPKCEDGRHLGVEDGRWKILTADDRPLVDTAFEYVDLVCNGPSIVQRDAKWGFISNDGKLLADRYFDRANSFHDGIAAVSDNGLWAVIGEDGSFLLGPLKLARSVQISGAGQYSIEFAEGYKSLDKNLIAELARNAEALTRPVPLRLPWSEGLAALRDDKTGLWGFVDASGKPVIPPRFDAVSNFEKGIALAAIPERREWCPIDKAGHVESDARCSCRQPLVIIEHYVPPPNAVCYDDGIRNIREFSRR